MLLRDWALIVLSPRTKIRNSRVTTPLARPNYLHRFLAGHAALAVSASPQDRRDICAGWGAGEAAPAASGGVIDREER